MRTNETPLARTSEIVVQELKDETLIYNLKTNQAIRLNQSAALVWKYCDGKTDIQQLVDLFNQNLNVAINEDYIFLTLDELAKADLLESYEKKFETRMSRRKVLLNYALPMAMVPAATTLIAPLAAHAASGPVCSIPGGSTCLIDTDCPPLPPCPPGCFCSPSVCDAPTNCCLSTIAC